ASFDEVDDKLRPEMGARVVFGTPSASDSAVPPEPALLVQKTAIVRVDGADGVFVLERDGARFKKVTLGGERSGRVIVKTGIADGQMVIDDPPASFDDGDRVRVEE